MLVKVGNPVITVSDATATRQVLYLQIPLVLQFFLFHLLLFLRVFLFFTLLLRFQLNEVISFKAKAIDGDYTACSTTDDTSKCKKPGVDSGRGGPAYPRL